jgi:hypothetical protein
MGHEEPENVIVASDLPVCGAYSIRTAFEELIEGDPSTGSVLIVDSTLQCSGSLSLHPSNWSASALLSVVPMISAPFSVRRGHVTVMLRLGTVNIPSAWTLAVVASAAFEPAGNFVPPTNQLPPAADAEPDNVTLSTNSEVNAAAISRVLELNMGKISFGHRLGRMMCSLA